MELAGILCNYEWAPTNSGILGKEPFCLLSPSKHMAPDQAVQTEIDSNGLDFWMHRVMLECDRARHDFEPDPVHDLRVALRRCRSIADGFMAFDPHPAWKQMKRESKRVFQQLGALRDIQVMLDWAQRFSPSPDESAAILCSHLANEEARLKETASEALQEFDRKKWESWARVLPKRSRRIPLEGMAFQHLALECWFVAHELYRQALRNRSHAAYHRLRIGLKTFRYLIENFLPSRCVLWEGELRELQDLLGEMHDLHVLGQTALEIHAFRSNEVRLKWREWIGEEINQRLEIYRSKMQGESPLWQVWRSGLPDSDQIRIAALARLRAWASFRDPDPIHSEHVSRLALQIYDGLDSLGLIQNALQPDARHILESAALVHDVGIYKAGKKHQIASYGMIRKLTPSPGWTARTLQIIALIARFHRRALPRMEQRAFSSVPLEQRKVIILLSGILRLANALDFLHQRRIRKLTLKRNGEAIYVAIPGYSETDASAEKIAAARHLLETACRLPIMIHRL
jgi:CHAD domain-containing protein